MNNRTYSITLANGVVIGNLRLNGSYYIADEVIDTTVFDGNCSPVTINDGETDDFHEHMEVVDIRKMETETWMALRDVSEEELAMVQNAASARYLNSQLVVTMSDEDAINNIDVFPVWSSNSKSYKVDNRVKYGTQLYKCLTSHVSQPSWAPPTTPSLWVRIDDPSVEWPEWVQPLGATDAYAAGAKVSHNDKHWVSDVDNNTWEPGVYGWTEQT